ncbi:MAG: outer membrane protein assembly factor BamB [Pseudomonadota bacterium]
MTVFLPAAGRFLLVVFLASLAGCSIFGGDDDEAVEPPTPLEELNPSVQLRRVLNTGIGKGGERLRLALRPLGDGARVYVANAEGVVTAFDAETSERVWSQNVGRLLSAGPGVGDGRVVVAGRDGVVAALNALDGEPLWERNISGEVLAPPVLGGNRVFLRTVDGRLVALDSRSGTEQWFVEQPVPALTQRGVSEPVIVGTLVVAGFDNGRIVAASQSSGEVAWDLPLGIPAGRTDIERMVDSDGAIAASGNDLYLSGFQSRTAAIAAESGQALWARDLSSYAGVGLDYGSVYITLDNDRVVALGRTNGAQQWSTDKFLRRKLTAPVVFGEYVVVCDFEGYVHLLSARTGVIAGRAKVGSDPIIMRPYVMGNTMYVQNVKGQLAGFEIIRADSE